MSEFSKIRFSKAKSFLGSEGRFGVDAVSPGVKASPSTKSEIVKAGDSTKPNIFQRAMKGDLTDKEMLGLSAGGAAIEAAAGLYDVGREFKRGRETLMEQAEAGRAMQEMSFQAQAEQSAKDFELRKEIGAKQHALALDMQNQKFEAAMDMIAEQTGIAKDQLMNDVQFSQTVSNINQLDTLLNLAKQQSMQPYDENTQQFFS